MTIFKVGRHNLKNPAPDPRILTPYDQLKVFRPLEHNLTNYNEYCSHLCADCKGKHYHIRGRFRPCMAPFICGRCGRCRRKLALSRQFLNQARPIRLNLDNLSNRISKMII